MASNVQWLNGNLSYQQQICFPQKNNKYISCLKGNSKSLPLLHAQVKRWEEQNRPDPCCDDMARYVAVLKVSHEAAVKDNEGLLHMATEGQRVD